MSGEWESRKEGQRVRIRVVLTLLGVTAITVLLLLALRSTITMTLDPQATNLPRPPRLSEEELQAALQTQAEEERFRFKMNGAPTFSADGEGDLLLQNPLENAKSIQVLITLDDTGEEVYKSAALPPGAQELRVTLSTVPPPGIHAATAEIMMLESVGEPPIGSMAVRLTLTITDDKVPQNGT